MPYKAPGTVLIISELISFVNFVSLLDLELHVVEIRLTLIGMREGTFHPLVLFGTDFVS
jgi:hypothetical protein